MQDRGQWTEDYARWRRRNSIAPDAKVLSLFSSPNQLCTLQQGMCNKLQQLSMLTTAVASQVILVVKGQPYADAFYPTKLCRPD